MPPETPNHAAAATFASRGSAAGVRVHRRGLLVTLRFRGYASASGCSATLHLRFMKTMITPPIPFVLSTALTGVSCYLSGMPRPDVIVALAVTAIVAGTVAYGAAFIRSRRIPKDADVA